MVRVMFILYLFICLFVYFKGLMISISVAFLNSWCGAVVEAHLVRSSDPQSYLSWS